MILLLKKFSLVLSERGGDRRIKWVKATSYIEEVFVFKSFDQKS
jgi:hypothetical protein